MVGSETFTDSWTWPLPRDNPSMPERRRAPPLDGDPAAPGHGLGGRAAPLIRAVVEGLPVGGQRRRCGLIDDARAQVDLGRVALGNRVRRPARGVGRG